MNNKSKTIKYLTLVTIALAWWAIMGALPARAQAGLDVQFEAAPLFKNLNILPGDSEVRWVRVINNDPESNFFMATKADNVSDTDNLSQVMRIEIRDHDSNTVYYNDTLAAFFAESAVTLSWVNVGGSAQYDYEISFDLNAGNEYQGKSLYFDILVGTEDNENEPGGGTFFAASSGGGNPYIPFAPGGSGNTAETIVLGEAGGPDLDIVKEVLAEYANPGDKGIKYRVTLTNFGNLTAFNTVLTDQLPAGFGFIDVSGQTRAWAGMDIAPGEIKVIEYFVNIYDDLPYGIYDNVASVQADNFGPVSDNASLAVKRVSVLGEMLEATGFSNNEFFGFLALIIGLLVLIIMLKKRYG